MDLVVERIASFREHLLTCDGREASQKSPSLAEPDAPTCNFRKLLHSRQKSHIKKYAKTVTDLSFDLFLRMLQHHAKFRQFLRMNIA